MSTKSNKVGFVGGMKSDLISKFENGFKAGAKAVNPNIEIVSEYAEAFDKPEKRYSSCFSNVWSRRRRNLSCCWWYR